MLRCSLLLATLACLTSQACPVSAANAEQGFLKRTITDADGKEAKYILFVPQDYKGDKAYPVILFLHGRGESGNDGEKQAKVGIGPAIKKDEKTFPFLVVFPQSQKATWDAESPDGKRAMAILAEVEKKYKVDPKRIYLSGLSMGGAGTWSLGAAYPDKWAALVPLCGSAKPEIASKIKDLPCWCFVGDKDGVAGSMHKMFDALKAAGGQPKFEEYPGVGHNCWDKAYGTKELYDWLLMQQRK